MINFLSKYELLPVWNHSVHLFFLIFGMVMVVSCIGLLAKSALTLKVFDALNYNVSTRKGFRALSVQRDIGRFVEEHRFWFAGFIMLGSAYTLFILFRMSNSQLAVLLNLNPISAVQIVENSRLLLLGLNMTAFAVGLLLCFSLHTLRGIQSVSDWWVSERSHIKVLERMHMGPDHMVASHPHIVGLIMFIPSLIVLSDAVFILK